MIKTLDLPLVIFKIVDQNWWKHSILDNNLLKTLIPFDFCKFSTKIWSKRWTYPLVVFYKFWTKFDQNTGLAPCGFYKHLTKVWSKHSTSFVGIFNFWLKFVKSAGHTICDFYKCLTQIIFDQNFNSWQNSDQNAYFLWLKNKFNLPPAVFINYLPDIFQKAYLCVFL